MPHPTINLVQLPLLFGQTLMYSYKMLCLYEAVVEFQVTNLQVSTKFGQLLAESREKLKSESELHAITILITRQPGWPH